MEAPADSISRDDYTISVLDGNHGPWLFVRRHGQVICELPGCTSAESAKEIGERMVSADIERRELQATCEHDFQPSQLLKDVEICGSCKAHRSAA